MSYYYYIFFVLVIAMAIQLFKSFILLLKDTNKYAKEEHFELLMVLSGVFVSIGITSYIFIKEYIGFINDITAIYVVLYGFVINYTVHKFYNHLRLSIFRHKRSLK